MIVRKNLSIKRIIMATWSRIVLMVALSTCVAFLHERWDIRVLELPVAPVGMLGTAIAILLGFRNNNAYDRWWEARRLWGAIINDSRTLIRQVATFVSDSADVAIKEMAYRQMAFAWGLCAHLRKQDVPAAIKAFLSSEELQRVTRHQNIPNALLLEHAQALKSLRYRALLNDFHHIQMDVRIGALCDALGACERIKNTVFPRQYGFYTTVFVWIFIGFLPFALVKDLGWLVIPAHTVVGFIYMVLDRVGSYIENPFENTINDVPMSAMSRTIEINLRQMLGETEIPAPLQPVDGYLY